MSSMRLLNRLSSWCGTLGTNYSKKQMNFRPSCTKYNSTQLPQRSSPTGACFPNPMPVIHPLNKLYAFVMPFAEKRHTATSHNKSETKEMVPSSTNHHSPPFRFQSSGFSNGEKKVEANGEDLAGFILARPVELQSQSNALLIPEDEQADSLTSSSWILPKPAMKRQRMDSHAKICLAMKSRYLVPLGRNVHNISPTFTPFEETTENKGQEHRSPLTSSDLFLPRLEL